MTEVLEMSMPMIGGPNENTLPCVDIYNEKNSIVLKKICSGELIKKTQKGKFRLTRLRERYLGSQKYRFGVGRAYISTFGPASTYFINPKDQKFTSARHSDMIWYKL